ncbi:DNA-processing protein DprA [Marinobacter alexandrii]|uniref:DNA-processing protein DprA n=1 Tax=Marinobacter alexandrii TaxID=2570351 RepID=UPI003267AFD8
MVKDKEYWRNEAVSFLALSTIKGVGYWTLNRLARSETSFKELLKNSTPLDLERALQVSFIDSTETWPEQQQTLWDKGIELGRALGLDFTRLIFREQSEFPASLKSLPDGPQWLFIQGSLEVLARSSVAVVGTRKPSDDGYFLAKYLIAALNGLDFVTVSGLASGIDQTAHSESIRYGIPTIAVLGNGIFNNYPKGSEVLRKKIIETGGAIVSEYLPYQSYSAENFVRRNRIQAGLADAVFPVEWKIKSGTAHTVDFAYRYMKKIVNLYLPGTIDDRPEISFSSNERGATAFAVPSETGELISYLTGGHQPNRTEETKPIQESFDL